MVATAVRSLIFFFPWLKARTWTRSHRVRTLVYFIPENFRYGIQVH